MAFVAEGSGRVSVKVKDKVVFEADGDDLSAKAGEVVVSASLVADHDARAQIRFRVRDTGIGIAADKLGLVFQEFTQADASMTRRFGGTGLGLAISRRLVTLMGGELTVTSELGRGSEFAFTLPLPVDAAPSLRARTRS